jgi:predicted MFS family arabinose efflux permease
MAFASFFGDLIGLRELFLVLAGLIVLSGLMGFWLLQEPVDLSNGVGGKIK